jgi:hypothetical protein
VNQEQENDMRFRSILAFLVSTAFVASAFAFNPQPDPPGFGMIGVVRGQTARVNVVINNPDFVDNPDFIDNPNILVRVVFVDDMGRVLGDSRAMVSPRRAGHFDYVAVGLRQQIRALVLIDDPNIIDDPNAKNVRRILGTLEVFDTESGQTAFVLPGTESFLKEVEPGKKPK